MRVSIAPLVVLSIPRAHRLLCALQWLSNLRVLNTEPPRLIASARAPRQPAPPDPLFLSRLVPVPERLCNAPLRSCRPLASVMNRLLVHCAVRVPASMKQREAMLPSESACGSPRIPARASSLADAARLLVCRATRAHSRDTGLHSLPGRARKAEAVSPRQPESHSRQRSHTQHRREAEERQSIFQLA
jgi:hypothetical protein